MLKPVLKAPGVAWSQLLKPNYDETAFKCCFQCQLAPVQSGRAAADMRGMQGSTVQFEPVLAALGFSTSTLNLMIRFQTLLSSSTDPGLTALGFSD